MGNARYGGPRNKRPPRASRAYNGNHDTAGPHAFVPEVGNHPLRAVTLLLQGTVTLLSKNALPISWARALEAKKAANGLAFLELVYLNAGRDIVPNDPPSLCPRAKILASSSSLRDRRTERMRHDVVDITISWHHSAIST